MIFPFMQHNRQHLVLVEITIGMYIHKSVWTRIQERKQLICQYIHGQANYLRHLCLSGTGLNSPSSDVLYILSEFIVKVVDALFCFVLFKHLRE